MADVKALYLNSIEAQEVVAELRSGELSEQQALHDSVMRDAVQAIVARRKVPSLSAQAGVAEAQLVTLVAGTVAEVLTNGTQARKKARKAVRESEQVLPPDQPAPIPSGPRVIDPSTAAALQKMKLGAAPSSLSSTEWAAAGPSLLGSLLSSVSRKR
jgi:hypothetical protein